MLYSVIQGYNILGQILQIQNINTLDHACVRTSVEVYDLGAPAIKAVVHRYAGPFFKVIEPVVLHLSSLRILFGHTDLDTPLPNY